MKAGQLLRSAVLLSVLFASTTTLSYGESSYRACDEAFKLWQQEKYSQSLAKYKSVLERNPQSAEALYGCGLNEKATRQYGAAIKHFDASIDKRPGFVPAYNDRGDAYFGQQKYDKAIADYTKAISCSSNNPVYYTNRGCCYVSLAQYSQAESDFDRSLKLDKNFARAYYGKGESLLQQQKYRKAVELLGHSASLNNSDELVHRSLGSCYGYLAQYDKALAEFNKAMELDPNDPVHFNSRGLMYLWKGENTKALADFEQCVKLDPDQSIYRICIGRALAVLGRFDEAVPQFDKAISLRPDDPDNFIWKATAERSIGKLHEALADCDRAIAIHKSPFAYRTRGLVRRDLKDNAGAIEDLDTAVKISPEDAYVYRDRERILSFVGRYEDAIRDCNKSLKLFEDNPQSGSVYGDRAHCEYSLGKYTEAAQDADIAVRIEPNNWWLHKMRSDALAAVNRYDEANKEWIKSNHGRYAEETGVIANSAASSPAQAWGLACSAVLFNSNGFDCKTLAGRPLTESERAEEALRLADSGSWNIHDRNQLLRQMDRLLNSGHHTEFRRFGIIAAAMTPAEVDSYEKELSSNPQLLYRFRIARKYYKQLGETGILGWDLSRAVNLCRMGYVAGFIDEDEAWARILSIAVQIQKNFKGWDEFGKNYLIGRTYWSEKETSTKGTEFDLTYARLVNFPHGPYKVGDWSLPLQLALKNAVERVATSTTPDRAYDLFVSAGLPPPHVETAAELKSFVDSMPFTALSALSQKALSENQFIDVIRTTRVALVPAALTKSLHADGITDADTIATLVGRSIYRKATQQNVDFNALLAGAKVAMKSADTGRQNKELEDIKGGIAIRRLLIGWQTPDVKEFSTAPKLDWPAAEATGAKFQVLESALFGKCILLLSKEVASEADSKGSAPNSKWLDLYSFDQTTNLLRKVQVRGLRTIRDVVVIGDKAYLLGSAGGATKLIQIAANGKKKSIHLPPKTQTWHLGAHENSLLVVTSSSIDELIGNKWTKVMNLPGNLPPEAVTSPHMLHKRIYFLEQRQPSWLESEEPGKIFRLSDALNQFVPNFSPAFGWTPSLWMNVFDDGVWVSVGTLPSIVNISSDGAIHFGLFQSSPTVDLKADALVGAGSGFIATKLIAGAMNREAEDLVFAGISGIYKVHENQIRPIVDFNVFPRLMLATKGANPADAANLLRFLNPTTINCVVDGSYLIGTSNGVVLISKNTSQDGTGAFQAKRIETDGEISW